MHNLLSYESKKKIKKEYRLRLLVLFLASTLALSLILFLSLIPSYIFSMTREKTIANEKTAIQKSVVSLESENLNQLLRSTKEKVESLKEGNNDLSIYVIIEKVLSRRNAGVNILGFRFTPSDGLSRNLTVDGVAGSRDSLVQFRKNLEQEKLFDQVSLPVSNFAKQSEIDFTLTLSITIN